MSAGNKLIWARVWKMTRGSFAPPYGFAQKVTVNFTGGKTSRKHTWETLDREQLKILKVWDRHGLVVFEELPEWRFVQEHLGEVNAIINAALDKVRLLYPTLEENAVMSSYDPATAEKVLVLLNENYPRPLTDVDLKHAFDVEPSDEALFNALDALHIEGAISGKGLFTSTLNGRGLVSMADIRLTAEGRQRAENKTGSTSDPQATHIFNNYGTAGAMGPHSVGTVNFQQQWASVKGETDTAAIVSELRAVIGQLKDSAESAEDYGRLQTLTVAKDQASANDGTGLLETLSRLGQGALPVLGKFGAVELLKLIEHITKAS